MAAIGSISSVSAALLNQIQQNSAQQQQQKPAQTQAPQDTVHLNKAALSALGSGSGDPDHDGD